MANAFMIPSRHIRRVLKQGFCHWKEKISVGRSLGLKHAKFDSNGTTWKLLDSGCRHTELGNRLVWMMRQSLSRTILPMIDESRPNVPYPSLKC